MTMTSQRRAAWGGWVLDTDTLVLAYDGYEIDLERCLTSAQTLDWIAQIADKNWGTDAVLAGLVRALDDVLHPQTNLCPWGSPKKLTRAEVATLARDPEHQQDWRP